MSKSEADIQRGAMLAIQSEWPKALIRRQNTGAGTDAVGNYIKFGTPGQGDVHCTINGLAIEVEVKTPKGKQSKKQRNYQVALERAGGIYILTRSRHEVVEQIKCKISQRNSAVL